MTSSAKIFKTYHDNTVRRHCHNMQSWFYRVEKEQVETIDVVLVRVQAQTKTTTQNKY